MFTFIEPVVFFSERSLINGNLLENSSLTDTTVKQLTNKFHQENTLTEDASYFSVPHTTETEITVASTKINHRNIKNTNKRRHRRRRKNLQGK